MTFLLLLLAILIPVAGVAAMVVVRRRRVAASVSSTTGNCVLRKEQAPVSAIEETELPACAISSTEISAQVATPPDSARPQVPATLTDAGRSVDMQVNRSADPDDRPAEHTPQNGAIVTATSDTEPGPSKSALNKQLSVNRSQAAIRVLNDASDVMRNQGESLVNGAAEESLPLPSAEEQGAAVQRFVSRRMALSRQVSVVSSHGAAGSATRGPEVAGHDAEPAAELDVGAGVAVPDIEATQADAFHGDQERHEQMEDAVEEVAEPQAVPGVRYGAEEGVTGDAENGVAGSAEEVTDGGAKEAAEGDAEEGLVKGGEHGAEEGAECGAKEGGEGGAEEGAVGDAEEGADAEGLLGLADPSQCGDDSPRDREVAVAAPIAVTNAAPSNSTDQVMPAAETAAAEFVGGLAAAAEKQAVAQEHVVVAAAVSEDRPSNGATIDSDDVHVQLASTAALDAKARAGEEKGPAAAPMLVAAAEELVAHGGGAQKAKSGKKGGCFLACFGR